MKIKQANKLKKSKLNLRKIEPLITLKSKLESQSINYNIITREVQIIMLKLIKKLFQPKTEKIFILINNEYKLIERKVK